MILIPFVLCIIFSFGISFAIIKINRGGSPSFNDEIFREARRELVNINNIMAEDSEVPDRNELKSLIENLQG
jgi:hypothetical protein